MHCKIMISWASMLLSISLLLLCAGLRSFAGSGSIVDDHLPSSSILLMQQQQQQKDDQPFFMMRPKAILQWPILDSSAYGDLNSIASKLPKRLFNVYRSSVSYNTYNLSHYNYNFNNTTVYATDHERCNYIRSKSSGSSCISRTISKPISSSAHLYYFPYYDTVAADPSSRPGFVPDYHVVREAVPTSIFTNNDNGNNNHDNNENDNNNNINENNKVNAKNKVPRGVRHYYSGNLMQQEFKEFRKLIDIKTLFRNISELDQLTANVWISEPDVHATAHYDGVNNLFVQLAGIKRVLLYPPNAALAAGLYGHFHPYACQSKYLSICKSKKFPNREEYSVIRRKAINNNDSSSSSISSSDNQNIDVMEVILNRGDILFIPPFWLHETFSIGPSSSISVSLWWESEVNAIMTDVMKLPLPFENEWVETKLKYASFYFISSFLEILDSKFSKTIKRIVPSKYIMKLLENRYKIDLDLTAEDDNKDNTTCTDAADADDDNAGNIVASCDVFERRKSNFTDVLADYELLKIKTYSAQTVNQVMKIMNTGGGGGRESANSDIRSHFIRTNDDDVDTSDGDVAAVDSNDGSNICDFDVEDSQAYVSISVGEIENRLAIMAIKACDYFEEIFRLVAELSLASSDNKKDNEDILASGQIASTVSILIEFINSI